jgi:hypothetical protein
MVAVLIANGHTRRIWTEPHLETIARIQRKVPAEVVHVHRAVRGGDGGQLAPDDVQRLDVVRARGRLDLEHGRLVEHERNLVPGEGEAA